MQTLNLRIMKCMQLEAFAAGFGGKRKATFHSVLASSCTSMLTLFLLDLTHVRIHFTLQRLSSLSCDLTRAKAAPADTALAPEKKCVCSDLIPNRRGNCAVWGTSVLPEEESEITPVPLRPRLWGRVFWRLPGLKISPAMRSGGICPCLCMGSCFGRALRPQRLKTL